MKRLKYEPIQFGDVVAGYEVVLPSGFRGVGETLDEAVRAAELAATTHSARVERLLNTARDTYQARYPGRGYPKEIPF